MNSKLTLTILVALAALLTLASSHSAEKQAHQSNRFVALGDLPAGTFNSAALSVSADGSVVVGYSNAGAGAHAFRWTRRDGMVGLGFSQATAVSADGSTVVGYRHIADRSEPVRWTQQGGLQGLGNIAGYAFGDAFGASADGSVIVGRCDPSFRGGSMAFHWTQASGIARLEHLPEAAIDIKAYAVSSDGEVIVGVVRRADGRSAAFRWTQKTGMVGLGRLPGGGPYSVALDVSDDGSTIVGQSHGEFGLEAFVWDATHGMRSVRQLLMSEIDLDASLRAWELRSATAVSCDGSVIVGCGTNPDGNREAWIARPGDKP